MCCPRVYPAVTISRSIPSRPLGYRVLSSKPGYTSTRMMLGWCFRMMSCSRLFS